VIGGVLGALALLPSPIPRFRMPSAGASPEAAQPGG
jgi:hypothetical protein